MDNDNKKESKLNNLINTGKNILKGHANELLKRNKELSASRMDVCKACPLYMMDKGLGPRCNPTLMIHPETKDLIDFSEDNRKENPEFRRGCGCRLEAKTTVLGNGNTCPSNFWNDVEKEYLVLDMSKKPLHKVDNEQLDILGLTRYGYKYGIPLKYKEDEDKDK